jgi:hypothetical protein
MFLNHSAQINDRKAVYDFIRQRLWFIDGELPSRRERKTKQHLKPTLRAKSGTSPEKWELRSRPQDRSFWDWWSRESPLIEAR